jgi:uncharacterized protein
VVADSGPLIVWGRLVRLEILRAVCGEVMVPALVGQEGVNDPRRPGAATILQGFADGLLVRPPSNIEEESAVPYPTLGLGESAAIRLANRLNCPVLMDEKHGRAVAKTHNVTVIGTLGIFLAAKRLGLIDRIKPLLEQLAQINYFVSPVLYDAALREAG